MSEGDYGNSSGSTLAITLLVQDEVKPSVITQCCNPGHIRVSVGVAHFSQMGKINDFRDLGTNGLNERTVLIHTPGDSDI